MTVDINVQGVKFTITVGAASPPPSPAGHITGQGMVERQGALGGTGAGDPTTSGGGTPGSGVVVIGPIVVGGGPGIGDHSGGAKGGTGAGDPTTSGGGTPGSGSGVVVIGPIVVCGQATRQDQPVSKAVNLTHNK